MNKQTLSHRKTSPLRRFTATLALLGFLITLLTMLESFANQPNTSAPATVQQLAMTGGVPNVVSTIILDLRLYDTLSEVIVFTLASMGIGMLLEQDLKLPSIKSLENNSSITLFRLAAVLNALLAIELALRGHLSPGGGFAAGVAGGTALALILLGGGDREVIEKYRRIHAGTLEEAAVLLFVVLSCLIMEGLNLPDGVYGTTLSGGMVPILNILVGIKVTLGSWGMVQKFLATNQLI